MLSWCSFASRFLLFASAYLFKSPLHQQNHLLGCLEWMRNSATLYGLKEWGDLQSWQAELWSLVNPYYWLEIQGKLISSSLTSVLNRAAEHKATCGKPKAPWLSVALGLFYFYFYWLLKHFSHKCQKTTAWLFCVLKMEEHETLEKLVK